MHPVYHAKITVSTKNFPRSEGRKCGVKGLVRRGLMVWRWSSPPSRTKSKYIANLPLDLRSIPLDLRSICPFVASKYLRSYDAPVYRATITVSTKNFSRSEGRKCAPRSQVNTPRSQVNLPIRSVQIFAKLRCTSLPRKDNCFDQEPSLDQRPSISGQSAHS